MNKPSGITNVESKVMVPVRLLEQHVNCKHHPIEADEHKVANASKSYSKHFENIFWCTEELEVDGFVEIYLRARPNVHHCFKIPVTTGLLVMCTKGIGAEYKMTWSSSLS